MRIPNCFQWFSLLRFHNIRKLFRITDNNRIFCTGKRLKRVGAAGTCGRFPGSPALPEKPAGIPIPGTVFPAAEFTPFGTPAGRFPHPTPRCCQRAARRGGSPWQSVSQHCSGDTASGVGHRTPGRSPVNEQRLGAVRDLQLQRLFRQAPLQTPHQDVDNAV